MSEQRVENDDKVSLYTEENVKQEIKNIVCSPNMKYMVTSDDASLILWTVDLDNNKIIKNQTCEDFREHSPSLLRLSNSNLLISGFEDETDFYGLTILDMENMKTLRNTNTKINPSHGNFLQFLPNGNLLLLRAQYMFVFTETSLKNSTYKYSSKYRLRMVNIRGGLEMVDLQMHDVVDFRKIIKMEQINGKIFFTLKDSVMIIQVNTEKWTIENKYIVPKSYKWIGTVNSDMSLFAIYLKQANGAFLCVYSMKNGFLISSRKIKLEGHDTDIKIRFIESNNIEVLMLYSLDIKNEEIKYVVTDPYELSYTCEYKYDLKKFIPNGIFTITKLPASQYNEILTQIIEYNVLEKSDEISRKLYDNVFIVPDKNDEMLSIYSRFKYIRDSYEGRIKIEGGKVGDVGKKLIWIFSIPDVLYVYNKTKDVKIVEDIDIFKIPLAYKNLGHDIDIFGLKMLDNADDDVIIYDKSGIIIFGLKSNKIVKKYFYHDIKKFLECKRIPCSNLDIPVEEDKKNMIMELLYAKMYIIEKSDEIIDFAIENKESEILSECLDILYELLTNDIVTHLTHFKIYRIITKYLQSLYLEFPIHYSKLLSNTSIILNPNKDVSYLSKEMQLYSPKYNFWKELLKPPTNPFVSLDDQAFYDSWNAEALLNFKWNTFGKYYYRLMWGVFTIFLVSFGVASTMPTSVITDTLLRISIIIGSFHIFHELRQYFWDPMEYITNLWNFFDLAAYILPVYTAIFWLCREKPQLALISISNLFLHFKFITFLRALDYFGSHFTIIVGVARRILSFLLILFLFLIGFAHAFYIILTPNEIYDMNHPVKNDDPNNPWNLVDQYQSVSPDNTISSEIAYIKQPDSNVNQFATYKTSLLAMYLFLTGDPSALSSWTYMENPFMTILLIMFSCLIVVYLMNLFIGLLNLEIEQNKTHCLFMLRKAKVLAEIELFLLLPNQRRWQHWFPDLIFYDMPIEK
ncbi:5226_t:CDS:2, partial [Funneliformis caledonium]